MTKKCMIKQIISPKISKWKPRSIIHRIRLTENRVNQRSYPVSNFTKQCQGYKQSKGKRERSFWDISDDSHRSFIPLSNMNLQLRIDEASK